MVSGANTPVINGINKCFKLSDAHFDVLLFGYNEGTTKITTFNNKHLLWMNLSGDTNEIILSELGEGI